MNESSMKHFKAAQIAGMEVSLKDLEKINSYALSRLEPKDIFAFKVSMAGNDIDRDFEVFPRSTLVKLANLFVGKTVVKDHEHKSDNQIARIFSTELVENDLARTTKTGEVFTELIAKCYMVKTSANADLIAEIQAGIRKEVSLGCRVDKAICSICGTDNVKTYCDHFPGKRYGSNQLCYFSLENASDAYELSFVAVPAQMHAGTVKSYGKKPCHEDEMKMRKKTVERVSEMSGSDGVAGESAGKRLTVNRIEKSGEQPTPGEDESVVVRENALESQENAVKADEVGAKSADNAPDNPESTQKNTPDSAPEKTGEDEASAEKGDELDMKEMLKQLHDIAQQLLAFQKSFSVQKEDEQSVSSRETEQDSEPKRKEPNGEFESQEVDSEENRLTVNQVDAEEVQEESSSESDLKDRESSPDKPTEGGNAEELAEAHTAAAETKAAEEAKDQEESKAKTAQARLRALDLALSLRKRD